MLHQKTILLASFINHSDIDSSVQKIKENFVLVGARIFVLRQKDDIEKSILTYNIAATDERIAFDRIFPNTINLHRKKETNTLYTLNALNEIVKTENSGILDKKFQINWGNWTNCIILLQRTKGLVRIETELEKVINLDSI